MDSEQPPSEVHGWLTRIGWSPGRDIGERADELIQVRVRDAERQGAPLTPVPAAVRFIHTYGLLSLSHPTVQGVALVVEPTVGYDGDVKSIRELARGLGVEIFPIGYESSEQGIILADETGRFFHLHHTGGYYLGENEFDAFSRFMGGLTEPDAEDFFA
ncbi:SUKH-3 domain-containing protein [Streptomyces sp. NPDC005962]|uniref:SUKH-3 domain-containing protein n=1 Tax=Streptomyces sp. NPDC005962 TaxID=3154466 RepID=UPI0034047FAA